MRATESGTEGVRVRSEEWCSKSGGGRRPEHALVGLSEAGAAPCWDVTL